MDNSNISHSFTDSSYTHLLNCPNFSYKIQILTFVCHLCTVSFHTCLQRNLFSASLVPDRQPSRNVSLSSIVHL